jgi:hypothetical protein
MLLACASTARKPDDVQNHAKRQQAVEDNDAHARRQRALRERQHQYDVHPPDGDGEHGAQVSQLIALGQSS